MSSMNDELGVQIGFKFESEREVMPKVKSVLDKISNNTNVEVHFGVDKNELNKILESTAKINKTSIQLDQDGKTLQSIVEINTGLNQTLKLIENTKGTKININNDFAKNEKVALEESLKLLQQEYQIKTQLLTAEGQYKNILNEQLVLNQKIQKATIDDNMGNKLLAEKVSLNEKYQQSVSKVAEQRNKQIQKDKEEQTEMQRLIALEKQRLNNKIALYSNKYKGNEDVQSLNRISNAIENLGKSSTNLKDLRKEFQGVSQEIKDMETSTKVATGNINKSDGLSFINNIKANITSLASYFMSGSLLYSIGNTFRETTSYVIELDSAMTNLKKVTDETDYTYKNFLNTAHEISMEFGSQSDKVVNAVTSWAKMGKTLEESVELSKSTMLLSKVGDVENMDTASKLMVAPLTAFNIEAEKSIDLIDKYNNISNNMATTTQDVGEGLAKSASSMAIAGNSLDETIALLSVAESKTKQGGEAIGTALRTISLRLASFKDDETGEPIVKLKDDLESLGVQAVDSTGQIRSTFDLLLDLSKIFNDLDRNTQISLSEKIGGKRQANYVSAILSDTEELQRAFELSQNSAGSAMQEFEKYQESIQYSVDRLKEQMNELYTNMINSNFLKGFVESGVGVLNTINKLSDSFGFLPSAITVVSTALLMFNKNLNSTMVTMIGLIPGIGKLQTSLQGLSVKFTNNISTLQNNIKAQKEWIVKCQMAGNSAKGMGMSLVGLNIKLALTTVKLIATKIATIALQTALSLGLSVVITGVVTLLSKMASGLFGAEKSMKDCSEQAKTLQQSLSSMKALNGLVDQYKALYKQLEDTNLKEGERQALNDKISQIKSELVGIEDGYYGILNNENLTLDEQLQKMKDIKAERLKKEAKDLDDGMVKQSDMGKKAEEARMYASEIEELNKIISETSTNGKAMWKGEMFSISELQGFLEGNKTKFKECTNEVTDYNDKIGIMEEANYKSGRSAIDLGVDVDLMTKAINSNTLAKKENGEVQFQHMSEEDALKSLKEATQEYGKANDEANKLRETIAKINSDGLTTDTITQLADQYSDLGVRINDAGEVQQYLNDKLQEQVESAQSAYIKMIANDSEFYQSKIANNEGFNSFLNSMLNSMVETDGEALNIELDNFTNLLDLKQNLQNNLGDATGEFLNGYIDLYISAYNFDSTQFASLNEAKTGYLNQVLGAVAQSASQFVGKNAEAYTKELRNFNDLSLAKQQVIADLDSRIKIVQQNYNNLLNAAKEKAEASGSATFEGSRALSGAKAYLQEIQGVRRNIDKVFEGLQVGYDRVQANFKPSNFKGKDIGSSNTGTGSKSKKSPSSSEKAKQTEKDVADLKKMTNAYHDVERALDLVNHKLNINKSLQDGATEKQKLKYMKDEVKLYKEKQSLINKQIKLYEKEQASLKGTLLKNDKRFEFDKSGNITNYNDIMKAWVKKANSLTGKAKEKYIDQVKQMQEYVERYEDITHKTLYGLKEDWKDLNNSIEEVLEEQNKMIMDAKQNAYEDVVWQVDTQQGNELEYKLTLLDEDDVQGKVEIMNTQLQNQNKILQASRKYLEDLYAMGLKPTDAGYADWIERLKEAEQEFHNQRMEFESMKDSLEDLVKNQFAKYVEQRKEIEKIETDKRHQQEKIDLEKKYFDTALAEYNKYKESKIKSLNEEIEAIKKKLEVEKGNEALLDILKAKQLELNELQSEQYEKITSWYELEEKMHNANIDAIDKELKALDEKNKLEEENEERLKRQNELIELQQKMQNIKKNKNIRELTKNDKGEFDWDYTYDRKALADANKEYKEKQEDLAKWEKDLELEKYKEKLNQQKEYEQEALVLLKAQYDKALALLEEKQTKESEVMDKKYDDMLKDTDKYLEDMLTKYDGSWTKIIEVLGLKLEEGNLQLDSFAQTTIATIDNLSAYIDGLYSKLEGLQNIDISSSISEGFTNPVVPNLPVVNSLSKTTSSTSNTYHVNANFPNATSSDEIEKALTSIGDNTTQYVGRR